MKRLICICLTYVLSASIYINIIMPVSTIIANSKTNYSFEEPSVNDTIAGWKTGNWSNNFASFNQINNGYSGNKSIYENDDAKWYSIPTTSLTPGNQYNLSVWYKTNTQRNEVIVHIMYFDSSDVEHYSTISNPLPDSSATSWQQYSSTFYAPQGAKAGTAFMLTSSNGWLQVGDYSVTKHTGFNEPIISLAFDDGWASTYTNGSPLLKKYDLTSTQYIISGSLNAPDYMTTAMVKNLQSQGDEIGSHTVTHPYLTKLTATKLKQELSQSQTTLKNLFGSSVAQDFASPYGYYNQTVLNAIKNYYRSHRSVDVGYNSKDSFDIYNILTQTIKVTTTPAEVASWVSQAKADKTWLVIVYHQVDTIGRDYSVTPANLSAELANIKASGISVKTIGRALDEITTQF
jgi:peptidoglycan/xylan/chitin deacetylase (PgdA/CDA1 family)